MIEGSPHWALLPAGFHDVLPPDAGREAAAIERLVALLQSHGYERVKPPLLEFEETLLGGVGAALAGESFRLMDPISQRMMAVRADMTVQIARVAVSRLSRSPRPLRLAYAGQVLRVRGGQLRPERQFAQVGAELIGAPQPTADAEIAGLAASALLSIGVPRLSLDLNVASLVPILFDAHGLDPEQRSAVRRALDRKDAALASRHAGSAESVLRTLMDATGPADDALRQIESLAIPDEAVSKIRRLSTVVRLLQERLPDVGLTVDLVEHRGFEYHRGVSFTAFSRGVRGELGRGGHYLAGGHLAAEVPATGFTLYMDSVLRALPPDSAPPRVFLPEGTAAETAERLRADGWVTVAALDDADPAGEAARLGCSHVLIDGEAVATGAAAPAEEGE